MAANSERSFNEAICRVFWARGPRRRQYITAAQHRAIKGGGMPDLILRNLQGAPVIIETEYMPARTVEQDAVQRLGCQLADFGDAIEQCIALHVPNSLQRVP